MKSGPISASRSGLLDLVEHLVRIGRDLRSFRHPFVPDDAASVEDEHGPSRDPFETDPAESFVLHPVTPAHGPVPTPHHRIIEMILFLEHPVAVMALRPAPDH